MQHTVCATLLAALIMSPIHKASAQQPTTSAQLPVAIGDIRISHFSTFRTNLRQLHNFSVTGKNIIVATTDPNRPLRFYLVVNGVIGHAVGPKGSQVEAELEGPIQFRVVHKVGQEVRTLQGTAGHARYNEQTQHLLLSEGVKATLLDSDRLKGPAQLQVENVLVATDKSGRLQLSGSADADVLTFVPKLASAQMASPRHQLGTVTIAAFTQADVDLAHAIQVSGAPTTISFEDVISKAKGTLSAKLIEAYFAQSRLQEIRAEEDVHFHGVEPDAKNRLIVLDGQADQGRYEAAQSQISLDKVVATLQIPQKLQNPAQIRAARLIAHLEPTTSYLFYGAPGQDLLRFSPQPSALPATQGDQARPISLGTVEIQGFANGAFVPGKSFSLAGRALVIQTEEPQTGFQSHIQSQRIDGTLSAANEIVHMATQGEVQCRFSRPYHPTGQAQSEGEEIVEATAAALVYTNEAQHTEVLLQGPTQITAQSPALAGPVRYIGERGDSVVWNLRSDDLVMNSPQSTARLEAVVPPPSNPAKQQKGKKP